MTDRTQLRDCELDAERVANVLRAQFPQLAPHAVRHLGAGWDHDAFEINGEWIARMPMRAEVAARVPVERAALQLAREVMTIAVPVPELHGEPSALFPYAFSVYRKLHGVIADEVPRTAFATPDNARILGRELSALQRVPIARAQALGVLPASQREHSCDDRADRVLAALPALQAALGPARMQRCAAFLAQRPLIPAHAGTQVLRHDDLHLEHILLDPDTHRITGVIDWTDANIGDMAGELVLLWVDCGEPFVRAILDAYDTPHSSRESNADLLERTRIRARWGTLDWLARALIRDPASLPERLSAFDRCFPRV